MISKYTLVVPSLLTNCNTDLLKYLDKSGVPLKKIVFFAIFEWKHELVLIIHHAQAPI